MNQNNLTLNDISFVIPSRNNLKYLKWAYASIRKNGGYEPWICMADDASIDGTWEWMEEVKKTDPKVKILKNPGPNRLGHCILYDKIVNELVETQIFGIYHADMYLTPKILESVLSIIKPHLIVSLTRIEPTGLHPPGPEKVLMDFGIEPEDFNEEEFLEWYKKYQFTAKDKTTVGIFAPWFIYKSDFQAVGGHDPLYAPQSKEDSDIFNRFQLAGYEFVQLWDAAIYHMTCRGSRFNPTLTTPGKNSSEWEAQNTKSTRNFIRKWGHFVKHDEFMKPIVPHKYDVAFLVKNCSYQLLELLEPWCNNIFIDIDPTNYIASEQPNTKFDLNARIRSLKKDYEYNNILVEFDGRVFNQESFNIIQNLSEIISESGEIGEFELDCFKIYIKDLTCYEDSLIKL